MMDKNEFLAEYLCEPPFEDNKVIYDLAIEYHECCYAYDRLICTGPKGLDGEPLPATSWQAGLINRHARQVFLELAQRARIAGFSEGALMHAIGRYRRRQR